MRSEIDALEHFFAAINRNDMQAMIRNFDPQIVRIEPEGFPTAGTYRGIAEAQEDVRTGSFGERVQALEWAGIKGGEL